jgi:hypothetical protein
MNSQETNELDTDSLTGGLVRCARRSRVGLFDSAQSRFFTLAPLGCIRLYDECTPGTRYSHNTRTHNPQRACLIAFVATFDDSTNARFVYNVVFPYEKERTKRSRDCIFYKRNTDTVRNN